MYKYFISIIIFSVIVFTWEYIYGQESVTKVHVKEKPEGSYPIAGSDLLRENYSKVAKFLTDNPDYFYQAKLKKVAAWNFVVGDTKFWSAYNYTTQKDYSVHSTCRAVGKHCYVFVADDVWGNTVDSGAVAAVVNDFDNKTPADPNKGVYQTDVDTFGEPPDVDNDPRIIILILDIIDGYSGSGGFVAGYFDPGNEILGGGLAAEIYFMDAKPVNLKTPGGLNTALTTAAHEFQHMINWNYHQMNPELTFINEGLSKIAEIVCGYGASLQSYFANEPNHYLFDWRDNDNNNVLTDYARAQRFFLYLKEQFGIDILKQIVQDYTTYRLVGIDGLNRILSQNYSTSLGKVFLNWEIANGLNNINVDPAYGYSYQPLPIISGTNFINPNIDSTLSTLQNLGAEYYTFSNSSNLSIIFSSTGSNIIVKALEIGRNSSRVVDVPLNATFMEADYPSVYDTIRFAAIDTNRLSSQSYSYQSSGTPSIVELKWDETEPTGYYVWSPNDTVCVTFDALAGGRLDSIRVALRRAGSITGGVWQYSSSSGASPLGKKLAVPITASINTTVDYPYPVPYSNWSTVDLRSYNIPTDQPFAVGFVIGNDPKTPGIMVTDKASASSYHSFTYLQLLDKPSNGPGWYYISTNDAGDSIAIYLIRAYASAKDSTFKPDTSATPTIPLEYQLMQNYPNPFNLTTRIDFTIPKTGNVKITVYNQLGQKVQVLTNRAYQAGSNYVFFDGANLSSGVYFYRIESGSFSSAKKMIFLK